jgi:hypothetical protein
MIGWVDSPDINTCCGDPCSRSKRLKVSSSVVVPPTFSGSPSFCASPSFSGSPSFCASPSFSGSPSFCGSPFHGEN